MQRKTQLIVAQLARGWRMPDTTTTWLLVDIGWLLLTYGDKK